MSIERLKIRAGRNAQSSPQLFSKGRRCELSNSLSRSATGPGMEDVSPPDVTISGFSMVV